jgi:hypothetical protein
MSVFEQFSGELARLQKQYSNAKGILALSGALTEVASRAARAKADLTVWNGDYVRQLLQKHPDVAPILERARAYRTELAQQMDSLRSPATIAENRSAKVKSELENLSAGRTEWRAYEMRGTRILTELFEPELGAPDIQTRSEDGMDIMDAVFPIRAAVPPWSLVRAEYQSRFAVAEFKNYAEEIGQKQIESLAQYLWKKAHRSFGILVSRKGANESALKARRRAWVEQDKLIVILKDEDLIDMAQLWEEDQDPFQVIDAQLEDFFRRLNP